MVLYRYDFRKRVASVLQLEMARVTILANSPSSVADGRCQKVSYMVSGKASFLIKGELCYTSTQHEAVITWKKRKLFNSESCDGHQRQLSANKFRSSERQHRPLFKDYTIGVAAPSAECHCFSWRSHCMYRLTKRMWLHRRTKNMNLISTYVFYA